MTRDRALLECRSKCAWESSDTLYEVLADGITGHGDSMAYYAASKRTDKATGKSVTRCVVFLIQLAPFGYKDMDEMMGPREFRCPRDVFEALDPLPDAPVVTEAIDCVQCGGTGKLPEPNATIDCWQCDGSGQVPISSEQIDRFRYARRWRRDVETWLATAEAA